MALDDRSGDHEVDAPAEMIAAPIAAAEPMPAAPTRTRRQRMRGPLLIAAPIAALIFVLFVYLHGGRYETTDNAYFQSGLGAVAANVSGQVIAVEVHDNQRVKAGQVLFRIDPAPFQATVDEAEAALADARTQVSSLQANYAQGQAELKAAQDQLAYAEREAARQKALLAEGISSQAQYDQARLAAQTAAQGIETSRQKNASVAATLSGRVDGPIETQPAIKRAQAALDRARLDLSYTVVRAKQDGIVTKVDQLQVGDYVAAAKPVFTLAGTRIWIEANFKESQLDHMRIGQQATVEVDAFPDLKLTGHVVSFSPGTGNSFALLPPENATGNWVKVVQRLPVELDIDNPPADVPLHAGLSVEVTVDTGHRRHLFGSATGTPPAGR
ncbi:HlyD family secretion protein [Sphingomonas sp. CGMCC 1.13654]|uniref:HlyD family secretion protein n=1 Tax=Sphingomonas chungangi TaxID=2683589 RepID=A0A838KZV3_9SPHN|nr:HlyD family secretion protein [Sphingomonas chungangi]MVW56234.1 HlyD family efflux transporter periplasmic adaptor subunit [Sphingomonas chungangi]